MSAPRCKFAGCMRRTLAPHGYCFQHTRIKEEHGLMFIIDELETMSAEMREYLEGRKPGKWELSPEPCAESRQRGAGRRGKPPPPSRCP